MVAATMSLEGVMQTPGSVRAGRDRTPFGRRAVLVMLAVRIDLTSRVLRPLSGDSTP
jgi:hypothetical protein